MHQALRVLLVEDSRDDAALLERTLRRDGLNLVVERVETATEMNDALDHRSWDVVLSDFTMPAFSGMAAFDLLRLKALDIPFIFVSGTVGEEVAVKAMKLGASDYFLKGNLARLAPAIEREVREREGRDARRRAEHELRQSEEQLRQSQKMEAVGRLAGGVAHDFNNMLSVILSYVDLMASDFAPDDSRLADLAEIRNAGKRAADLTKQLLLFSRQPAIETKVLDLNELLANVRNLLARAAGDDVELVCRFGESPARVQANPGHLEQVLMNLVVNARDAMPGRGRMTIETSEVELTHGRKLGTLAAAPGPYVRIAVSDTGTGMDRETRERIFEPFFTTKVRGKGTGLGLSTVFGIVQQSGGAIEVTSELGRGTTFEVYLPRVNASVDTVASAVPPPTVRGTETILVVEDEDAVRAVVCNILSRQGYETIGARSPEEALVLCREHQGIGMLLSDIVMPHMSGIELSRLVVEGRPAIRVLLMSGYADEGLERYELDSNVAFLQKPITPESLTRRVREVLDRPESEQLA
jgi:two-component system, cell cycle sensor histidine kinase and response regulator CckA